MHNILHAARLAKDERGSVGVVFGLTAIPVVLIIGMAIDYGRAINVDRRLQSSLDSAVLAASNQPSEKQAAYAAKFFNTNFTLLEDLPFGAVTTNFRVDNSGNFVGAAVTTVPTTFMHILGVSTLRLNASATAKPNNTTTVSETTTVTNTTYTPGNVPCIHVLDQNATSALKLISNSQLDARNCEVYVRSNDSHALYTDSESQVKWKKMWIKGSGGIQLSGKDTILDSPFTVQFNQQVTGDPFSAAVDDVVHAITVGSCSNANTGKTYTGGTVNPGTYCGATTFNGVTFNPGLYIVASGNGNANSGALTLKGKLDGKAGVSFYFADSKSQLASYTASEGSVLTAPSTGTSQGLLFFEASNRGQTWNFTASSLSKNFWNGVIYLPSANITMKSWSTDSGTTMSFALVCNTLYLDSWSGVTNTYAWTPFNASAPITLAGTTTTTTTTQHHDVTTTKNGWLNQ